MFPWMAFILLYYLVLARGFMSHSWRMWQFWIGHGPTYARAFWIALRARTSKPAYQVTRKTRLNGFYGHLLWPQFLYLFAGVVVIIHALFAMPDASVTARLSNIAMLVLFMALMSGICQAAFYGVSGKDVIYGLGGAARMAAHRTAGLLSAPLRRRAHSVVEHDD